MFRTLALALALAAGTAGGAAAVTPVVPPEILGTPAAGQTLTASSGGWLGIPASYAYAWERCDAAGDSCAAIAGAGSASYLASAADVGSTLRVVVTADGTPSVSAPTGVVLASAPAPSATTPAYVQPETPAVPNLSIVQVPTRSALTFGLGDTSTVVFSVQNSVADVQDAMLGLSLPAGLQLVSATTDRGECATGPPPTCDLGALAAGDTVTVSVTVEVLEPGTQAISAWVWHDGADGAPADNQVVATVQGVQQPNVYALLAGTARATVGTDVRYVFTVKNGGPQDASPVAVLVTFTPAAQVRSVRGATCQVQGGRASCTIPTLAAQASKKLTVVVRFAKPGSYAASLRAAEGTVSAAQPPWVTLVTRAVRR